MSHSPRIAPAAAKSGELARDVLAIELLAALIGKDRGCYPSLALPE